MYKSHGNRPQGGGWKSGKDRAFGGGGFRRDDRGFDRPQMHQATCASCGNGCEVPFKPNGSRPIYCRECFKKDGDSAQPMRFDRDSGSRGFDREEKRMFQATCADCGEGCEVPFKPNGSKPVYCRACFGNAKEGATSYKEFKREAPANGADGAQLAAIAAKLDMVLKALERLAPAKAVEAPKAAEAKAEKAPKASKAPAKKAAAKKKK